MRPVRGAVRELASKPALGSVGAAITEREPELARVAKMKDELEEILMIVW